MFNLVANTNPTKPSTGLAGLTSPKLKLKGKWGILKKKVQEREGEFSKILKGGDSKALSGLVNSARKQLKKDRAAKKAAEAADQKKEIVK